MPTRGKAASTHLAVVGLSFLLSFVVVPSFVPFDPEGAAGVAAALAVLVGHAVALAVGLLIPKRSIASCALVFCIAFFFTAYFGVGAYNRWRYHKYHAPYDRFRDYLASPVPQSVSNLRFVPFEDSITPDLMFQFDIDPADMDAILKNLKLEQVDPHKMLNPKDFFQYPYYLPIEGGYHFFQGKDKSGNVLTIKTNELHSHAIFRQEWSRMYDEREWDSPNPNIRQMNEEHLERLQRRYGK
jgi:hypothetical protein